MGISQKSHGKKSDKETQSPVLKIFKEMVRKDKKETNPEKANLLNTKNAEKKRRHYSAHRAKSDQKSVESSVSDIRQYKESEDCNDIEDTEYQRYRTQSLSDDKKAQKNEDTCSCVSCALKKLITSDFACVGCLALLFSVSVIVACLLVYKCIPTMTVTTPRRDNERLKRKIDSINTWGSFLPKSLGIRNAKLQEIAPDFNTIDAESELSKILDDSKLNEITSSVRLRDFYKKLLKTDANIRRLKKSRDTKSRETSSNLNFDFYPEREKRSIRIFREPLRLFNFRKSNKTQAKKNRKTMKVTVQPNIKQMIESLPKSNKTRNKRFNNDTGDTIMFEKDQILIKYNPKKVPKCSHSPNEQQSHEHQLKHPFYKNSQRLDELLEQFSKNLPNIMNEQFGLDLNSDDEKSLLKLPKIIEDMIGRRADKNDNLKEYKTVSDILDKRVNSKDFKTDLDLPDNNVHANDYKTLLDMPDRNLNSKEYKTILDMPDSSLNSKEYKTILDMPDSSLNSKEYKTILDMPDSNLNSKEYKTDFDIFRKMRNGSPNMDGTKTNGYADFDVPDTLKRDRTAKPTYDVLLSVSTILNQSPTPGTIKERMPNMRKILQAQDDDQEGIGYEDFKEVLADDNVVHDDTDKQARRKRDNDFNFDTPKYEPPKYHRPNVNNPNWKGPMPLYPDEINTMIKQETVNKGKNPVTTKYTVRNIGKKKIVHFEGPSLEEQSDMDYMEDYLDTRYNKLANLAQAYSDYGVLEGKKNAVTDRQNDKMTDKRDFIAIDENTRIVKRLQNSNEKNDVLKTDETEGPQVEIPRSNSAYQMDDIREVYNVLTKHIKMANDFMQKVPKPKTKPEFDNPSASYEGLKAPPVVLSGPTGIPKQYKDFTKDCYGLPMEKDKEKGRFLKDNAELVKDQAFSDTDKRFSTESFRNTYSYRENEVILFKKRSLKSFKDVKDSDETIEVNTNNNVKVNNSLKFKKRSLKSFNDSNEFDDMSEVNPRFVEMSPKNHTKAFNGSNEMNLSDFFGMLAHVFSALDEGKTTEKMVATTDLDDETAKTSTTDLPEVRPSDAAYALYNSDMIGDIGHRSRVLLSINLTDSGNKQRNKSIEDKTGKLPDSKLVLNKTSATPSNETRAKNRTVVKRNARNVIFWNDIYDDEYGVKTDVLDNLKDKSNRNDFIRRSNDWFQDKVKRFGDNIYRGYRRIKKSRSTDFGNEDLAGRNRRRARIARDSNNDNFKKTDFNALTAHMKDVCKKAASAVRESRQSNLKEDNKDSAVTTGLMKQLVGLMNDLIDYQVQQKTCMKLPPDLHNFLEWLTDISPEDAANSETESFQKPSSHDLTEIGMKEKSSDPPSEATEREDPGEDLRSDCLGTLKTVQELLVTYDNMLDEDKSKMTGVKEYLLNQMKFLRSQISSDNINKINSNIVPDMYRFKRQLNSQRRKKHGRFLKNFSKKHTKTTASFYDGATFTDNFIKKIKEKRNLRDVYYKAVAESKKITTVKNIQNG